MCSIFRHFLFLGFLVFFLAASPTESAPSLNPRDEPATPEELRFLLIQRLLEGSPKQRPQSPPVRKRTCYINAGLSHGCDYKDLVGALAETNYWDSLHSPGRKRRSPERESDGDYSAQQASYELSSEA